MYIKYSTLGVIIAFNFCAFADRIIIKNSSNTSYWVSIFYTTNNHTSIAPDENGKFPKISHIKPRETFTIERPPFRNGYDRDIIAFTHNPQVSKFRALLSDAKKQNFSKDASYITYNFNNEYDGFFLNVGLLQFVHTVEITDTGIQKIK